jgi:hypothetical protein
MKNLQEKKRRGKKQNLKKATKAAFDGIVRLSKSDASPLEKKNGKKKVKGEKT